MKIPEAIKEEFALLKDEMIEQFRDFLPDPQKYVNFPCKIVFLSIVEIRHTHDM